MTEREKKILYLAVVKNDEYVQRARKDMKGHLTLDDEIRLWFSHTEQKYKNELSSWR